MENLRMMGTVVNALLILVGCGIGTILRWILGGKAGGERMRKISDAVCLGVGLCVLVIGITGAIKPSVNGQILGSLSGILEVHPEWTPDIFGEESLVVILSMALGALVGELLNPDRLIGKLGEKLQERVAGKFGNVADGFITATLLFCVGSMAIVGSLNSGLYGDHTILYTKGTIDLVSAIVLTLSMGIGVGFSAAAVFVYQGALTLISQWVAPFLTTNMITCISGIGSILIIGLSLDMLGIKKVRVMNLMPAVLFPLILIPLFDLFEKI